MEVVGARMRSGECFIPRSCCRAHHAGALEILKPHLAPAEGAGLGTIVIGTVEGRF